MTLTELSKACTSQNIHPIHVEKFSNRDDELVFIGTLDEYLNSIKILGAKAAFIRSIAVTEEHFDYIPEEIGDTEEYDLCSVTPELESYRGKIGEIGCLELSACNLTYSIYEDWMLKLEELRNEAQESIDAEILSEEDDQASV